MYKLVIADEEGSTSTVPVIRDEITIGRQEGNTIRLTERDVSRQHARVIREDGRIFVEDIAARYGVKKNGVKIDRRVEFAPGDIVSIGAYQLTLKAKQGAQQPSASAPPVPAKRPPADLQRDEGTQVLPAMPAKLVVISSNFAGQEFPLNRKEMIIGRGEDCDIIIDHRSVSQRHAKVVREMGNKYQIVDLNSKNGIVIGGEQYRAVQVKRGDVIELGHVKFRFVEPGENYVFTPQATLVAADDEFSTGSKSSKLLPVALLLIALLIGGGGFYLFAGGDGGTEDSPALAAIESGATPRAEEANKHAAQPAPAADPAAIAEAADSSKVGQAIQEASANIRAGHLDKAIGALDSANKYLNPTPEQQNAIAELIGTANNEKPFKKDYLAAQNYRKSKDYSQALERLAKIPEHSIFYKLSRDEGMMTELLDGLVATAQKAAQNSDEKDARKLAEEALIYNDEHVGALALIASLDQKEVKVAARTAATPNSSKGGSARKSSGRKSSSVSAAEAKELYVGAQRKIFQNDPGGAISDCQKALRGGHSGCYRILAIAYKQQGNSSAACKNFKRYLGTKPANASAVQRQMEQLGCQ